MEKLCRVLGVSRTGYYAWRKQPVSARAKRDEEILAQIRLIYAENKRRYGSPRVYETLKEEGCCVGRKRVERLMREGGLIARAARKYRVTTDSSHQREPTPDLVVRNFAVSVPDTVWVGDITYLWTSEGWMYLAVFIDLYSRLVVGWALDTRLTASLVLEAFTRASMRRNPSPGLIVHTDRGIQYASDSFVQALRRVGARQSMSPKGDCWSNAVAESFFHSFKVEAIYGETFETRRKMEYEVFDYIERFYNRTRKHSVLGYQSPLKFEERGNPKAAA